MKLLGWIRISYGVDKSYTIALNHTAAILHLQAPFHYQMQSDRVFHRRDSV